MRDGVYSFGLFFLNYLAEDALGVDDEEAAVVVATVVVCV